MKIYQVSSTVKRAQLFLQALNKRQILSFAFAILVSGSAFLVIAMKNPIGFDGAMNLQVAQNLAQHGKYARTYDFANGGTPVVAYEEGYRYFPREVETNGAFTFVATVGFLLFGENQFSYQFSNLIFIVALAAVIWWLFRRWLIAAAITPPLALLSLPETFSTSLGGYGEVPGLFFVILSFALVVRASSMRTRKSALSMLTLALVAVGLAANTKVYLVGALPALLVGAVGLKLVRKDVSVKDLVLRLPYVLIGPALFEIFKLINIGSLHTYLVWWKLELKDILQQAGLLKSSHNLPGDNTTGLVDATLHRLHAFLLIVNDFILIIILSMVTIALLGFVLYSNKKKFARALRSPYWSPKVILASMLGSMFVIYLTWWAVLLPVTKTFPRRVFPIMLPLELLAALLLCVVVSVYFSKHHKLLTKYRSRKPKLFKASKVLVSLLLTCSLVFAINASVSNTQDALRPGYVTLEQYEQAAEVLKGVVPGHVVYGLDWWSSPTISLMAGVPIKNVAYINKCELEPERDLILWDRIASAITKSPEPYSKDVGYKLYKDLWATQIFKLSSIQSHCD
ncbi:hypothetical protein BH09PAT4_BH09PAT4_03090 [soil metagenome]